MAFPAAATFALGLQAGTGATALEDFLAATKQLVGAQDSSELTIAAGSVTAAVGVHTLDTESNAAADDLTNIVVTTFAGTLLLVGIESSSRVVTLKHAAGGAGQLSLAYGQDLIVDATSKWVLFRVDNGASPVTLKEVARFGFGGTAEVEHSTAGVGSPNILTEAEVGKLITNKGATAKAYNTLPAARKGLGPFLFVVEDADGLRVTAGTGDTIRCGASVSGAGGYAESTTIGDYLVLYAIDDTQWFGLPYSGFAVT